MGYELRLYAGELSTLQNDQGERYMDCILSVDLCKPGYKSNVANIDTGDGIDVYFYYGGKINSDSYEETVKAYPLAMVINALELDAAIEDYRRFPVALAALKSLSDKRFDNVYVAFVGH
mgnify:CR=1 FL=1